ISMKTFINKSRIIASCTIFLLAFGSCNNEEFLENETKSLLTDNSQWSSSSNADIYINDIYSQIPRVSTFAEQLDYYSDDYNISHYYTSSNWRQGITLTPGGSTDNPWGGSHGPTHGYTWELFFEKIRKCNTGLKKL